MTIKLITSNYAASSTPVTTSFSISGANKIVIAGGLITGSSGYATTLAAKLGGAGGASPTGTIFKTNTNSYYTSFMYYWLNPADAASNVYLTWSDGGVGFCAAAVYDGVDLVDPLGTLKTGNALALSGITCQVDDMLFDIITASDDTVGTKDANWTLIGAARLAVNYGAAGSSYKLATSESESSTWTGFTSVQLHNAQPIRPLSATAHQVSATPFMMV